MNKNLLSNFIIRTGNPISDLCLSFNLTDFYKLSEWLTKLPYGRTSSRTDLTLLFSENRGTCSSKHGLFKTVALENDYKEFDLIICIYKMHEYNTPGIGSYIQDAGLKFIPEAHAYIRSNDLTIDLTSSHSDFERIKADVLDEIVILPKQIGTFKVDYHQEYLKKWIKENNISLTLNEVWKIREMCISNLSG